MDGLLYTRDMSSGDSDMFGADMPLSEWSDFWFFVLFGCVILVVCVIEWFKIDREEKRAIKERQGQCCRARNKATGRFQKKSKCC